MNTALLPADLPLVDVLALVAERRLVAFGRDRGGYCTRHWATADAPFVPAVPVASMTEARLNWAAERDLVDTAAPATPAGLTSDGWDTYARVLGRPLTPMETEMATKSSDGGQTFLDSEAEAIAYLAERFPGEPSARIAHFVDLARADMVEQEENPNLWWDGIDRDELVSYVFGLI